MSWAGESFGRLGMLLQHAMSSHNRQAVAGLLTNAGNRVHYESGIRRQEAFHPFMVGMQVIKVIGGWHFRK